MKRIAALAKPRGMTFYGASSFMGLVKARGVDDGICACNPETLALVKGAFEKAARAGCTGLVYNFDDLTREVVTHHERCTKCRARFSHMAEWQLVFIKQMVDVAREHGIKKLIMCPTPYSRGSADHPKYKDYFKVLCSADFMKDVLVFHCEILPEKIQHLKELGLRNYIWWDNGLWPSTSYFDGQYMGIPKLHYVWYGTKATATDAVAPVPEVMEALRNFGDFCDHVYPSPTGSFAGRAMGGCLGWSPKHAVDNQPALRKALVEMLYGRGAWEPYKVWEDNLMAWFAAYRYRSLSLDVAKATAEMDEAEKALDRLVELHKTSKGLNAPSPLLKAESAQRLSQMRSTIANARESMKAPSLPPPIKRVAKTPAPKDAAMWLRFGSAAGDRLADSASKDRFGLFRGGNPSLKRGVFDNGLFFNGKDNYLELPATSVANLNPGRKSFSVDVWVFMMGHAWNEFVGKRSSGRDVYRSAGWSIGSDRRGNILRFNLEDKDRNYVTLTFSSGKLLYKWHHLAAVRDASARKVYFYFDGELRAEAEDPTGEAVNDLPVTCGIDRVSGGRYWGFLDEATYWSRALTADEVKARAKAGFRSLGD